MFQVHFARPARHISLHAIVYLSHSYPRRHPHNVWGWCLLGFWVLVSRQHDMNTFMWTSEFIVPTKTSVCKQGVWWWTHHAMFKPPQNIGSWKKVPSFQYFIAKVWVFAIFIANLLVFAIFIAMQRSCCDIFSWLRYFFVFLRYFFQREFRLRYLSQNKLITFYRKISKFSINFDMLRYFAILIYRKISQRKTTYRKISKCISIFFFDILR
jgi:hypothetical protein